MNQYKNYKMNTQEKRIYQNNLKKVIFSSENSKNFVKKIHFNVH